MSVGWPQDSRVSQSMNQPAINHLVQLSVLGQWSHLFSQSTSYKSFSVLVSSDRRVSYSVNKPAINYSVIWSVPGQWSQFFFQTSSHKSFSQLVSPRTEDVSYSQPTSNTCISFGQLVSPWEVDQIQLISQSTRDTFLVNHLGHWSVL